MRLRTILASVMLLTSTIAFASVDEGSRTLEDARARLEAGELDAAADAFKKAFDDGYMPHEAAFGAAEVEARRGDAEAATEWLGNAAKSGFRDFARVRRLASFASLLESTEFATFVDETERRVHPCWSAEYRALDFWVGEWSVTDSSTGNPAGRSRIEVDMDRCVVVENWTGRTGWTGRSFNVFRRDTGKWQQTWTDSSGQIYDFAGEPSPNRMTFVRETKTKAGDPRTIRMTLSKLVSGNVRQLSERTDDGGKTWAVNYDFTYHPVGGKE